MSGLLANDTKRREPRRRRSYQCDCMAANNGTSDTGRQDGLMQIAESLCEC